MHDKPIERHFRSILADLMSQYCSEKIASGERCETTYYHLRRFDDFLFQESLSRRELPKALVNKWTEKRHYESAKTHQLRVRSAAKFAVYMNRSGLPAYIPSTIGMAISRLDYTPYIFRHDEIIQLLAASERLPRNYLTPFRHLAIPVIFRLLSGCGLRTNEALKLRVADVDLDNGILTILDTKFRKDRLVPVAPAMAERLRIYAATIPASNPESYFFPAPDGGHYNARTLYFMFRRLLTECGIGHGGRGKGPRVHDLRHTFAVHRLLHWYREGVALDAMLPVLAVYLGHQRLTGTQRYLRLTPEIFPDIIATLETSVGSVIPRRVQ